MRRERCARFRNTPGTETRAKSNDATTWRTLTEAIAAFVPERGGIEFALGEVLSGDRVAGVDLDNCRDPGTGAIEPWAQQIIEEIEQLHRSLTLRHRSEDFRAWFCSERLQTTHHRNLQRRAVLHDDRAPRRRDAD